MVYELYYWPTIQGRGEFVRLALEDAGAEYIDVARETESGVGAMLRLMNANAAPHPSFAPPFLRAGDRIIGQTANILLFLGPKLGLVPGDEMDRLWAHQLQLTVSDFLVEVHDTHHPIAGGLYYQEQKAEAKLRAADFIAERLPKFLSYFEQILASNPHGPEYMVGATHSYVDLSMFQIVAGLRYAFPHAMKSTAEGCPHLIALHERVRTRPEVARYLASPRRVPFNQLGIFRHYKELDS
jgi:glutathione S-transferase